MTFLNSVLGHEGYGKVILSNREDVKISDILTFTLCNVCTNVSHAKVG